MWWNSGKQFEADILQALRDGEHDGLSLLRSIETVTGRRYGIWRLYPTLYRLEQRDVIIGRWGEATAARGWCRKRYYKLAELPI